MKIYFGFFLIILFSITSCSNGGESIKQEIKVKEAQTAESEMTSEVIPVEEPGASKVDKNIVEEKVDEGSIMDVFDPDFANGKWEAEDHDGFSFSTWFYVEDGILKGQYCAINEDASRIDCGTQDEVDLCYLMSESILGAKDLEIEVVSCYSQKKGRAILSPHGDGQLKWSLTEAPGEFGIDHFAPSEAILFKVSFDPFE